MQRLPRLLLLVDTRSYIRSNCYQRQLASVLHRNFRVRMMSLAELQYAPLVRVGAYDVVLSVLKLRTLVANADRIAQVLGKRALYVYEQDPWQSFMDDSPFLGAYERIVSKLNVAAFLVTSLWWSRFIAKRNLPVKFVRMGMLPELCNPGPDWGERPILLGFQGTLHSHRRAFVEQLGALGLDVEVLPSAPYETYLENLHRMRIFVHTEASPWLVDGALLSRNALWIKETEVAARGTFAIRDYEDEAEAYGVSELPTIFAYRSVPEVVDIVAKLQAMGAKERRERMVASAEAMRRRDDWMTVVRAIQP